MLDTIQAINRSAAFNRWAGFDVTQAADGQAELRMKWREEDMGQYTGFLHAGMIAAHRLLGDRFAAGRCLRDSNAPASHLRHEKNFATP